MTTTEMIFDGLVWLIGSLVIIYMSKRYWVIFRQRNKPSSSSCNDQSSCSSCPKQKAMNQGAPMKAFMPQKTHLLKLVQMLMTAVIFALVNNSFAQADVPESKNYQGIQYITGGIGSEEYEAMLELGKKWALILEFSQAHPQRPLWAADVTVKIIDQKKKVVFDALSDGPILLVNLAPGNYELQLSFEGKPLKRTLNIEENKPIKLSITWPI